jgi:hypothetical protein
MGGGWYLLAKESILPPSAAGGLKRPASLSAGIVLCAGFWFRVHLTSLHSPYNRRRARIARGVVVNDDDRRAVALDGVAENLAHPDVRGVEAPDVQQFPFWDCMTPICKLAGVENGTTDRRFGISPSR